MSQPWMPLYVGDYLADTRRLSTLEHGAYLLLIMDYWQNGSLPNDDGALARIAGLTGKEWASVRKAISPLFHDGWTHKRIDAELQRSRDKSQSARSSAAASWRSRRNANASADAMRTHCESSCGTDAARAFSQPQYSPEASASVERVHAPKPKRAKPRTPIDPDSQPTAADRLVAEEAGLPPEMFRTEWRKFRDHHLSKGSLMADWAAAWRTWVGNVAQFQLKTAGKNDGHGKGSLVAAGIDLIRRIDDAEQRDAAQTRGWPRNEDVVLLPRIGGNRP